MTKTAAMLGLVLVAAFPAHAVVLCAKPRLDGTFSATVKIREACSGKEVPLDPAALGLKGPSGDVGPAGSPGAPGPQGPKGPSLVVIDARGEVLGTVGWDTTIIRPVSSGAVSLRATASGNFLPLSENVYYETPDCSGAAFFARRPDFFRASEVRDNMLYFDAGEPEREVHYASRWRYPECTPEVGSPFLAPAATDDLSVFVPPFLLVQR